jgi:polyphosphate kinase 2 (PPK2 family)
MKSKTTSRSHSHAGGRHASHTERAALAREHYRREKERRARRPLPESDVMEAARREYLALLEAEAAKGKGGRPKKKAAAESTREEEEASDE